MAHEGNEPSPVGNQGPPRRAVKRMTRLQNKVRTCCSGCHMRIMRMNRARAGCKNRRETKIPTKMQQTIRAHEGKVPSLGGKMPKWRWRVYPKQR